jgi:hypothetical protein
MFIILKWKGFFDFQKVKINLVSSLSNMEKEINERNSMIEAKIKLQKSRKAQGLKIL